MNYFKLFVVLFFCIFAVQCGRNSNIAGGSGSVTTNGISGVVTDGNSPVEKAKVAILPVDYNPVTNIDSTFPLEASTDSEGKYNFGSIPSGTYNIVSNINGNSLLGLKSLEITAPLESELVLEDIILSQPGFILISLKDKNINEIGTIYIMGTELTFEIGTKDLEKDSFYLTGMESHNLSHQYVKNSNPASPEPLYLDTVNFIMGDTIILFPEIKIDTINDTNITVDSVITVDTSYKRTITLHLDSLNSPLIDDLYNFPLLIRLNDSNFDFRKSEESGGSLNFKKLDGTNIPFSIENWDSKQNTADIWIRVDTLFKDSSQQQFKIVVEDTVYNYNIFDEQHGFSGVWHLNELPNDDSSGYKDASTNDRNGIGTNRSGQISEIGIIGNAQKFDGNNNFITFPFPTQITGSTDFTLSFWLFYNPDSTRQWVAAFGHPVYGNQFHLLIEQDSVTQFGVRDNVGGLLSNRQNVFDISPYSSSWVFVTITFQSNSNMLTTYVNGNRVDQDSIDLIDIIPGDGFTIGKNYFVNHNDGYFNGSIDEFKISHFSRSEDWIKASYNNQRQNSSLVIVE